MKALAITILLLTATMLQAQDTIKVDLTALQAEKIAEINKTKEEVKKQYEQAVKQLDQQLSEHLIFIADANAIDPKRIQSVQAIEAKSITFITKE